MGEELNEAQRRAVEHDAGPLIVLAGPGTGKTRVIVHRIAHAINERRVPAESVLAVTFTVKAAQQLRDRLVDRVGPARAGAVRVHTFNGFGMRLLQRFGDLAGLPATTTMLDPVQAARLTKRIVQERNLFLGVRGEGLSALASDLQTCFESLSHTGKSPEDCVRFAASWREMLDRGRTPASDAPSADELAASRAACARFADEADAWLHTSQERWARGWLTYSDQIVLPIRVLRDHGAARALLRGETRMVVVDEFQDCNTAQIELLRLIAGPEGSDHARDVCVVGDDDQAIYAFRGADDRAFQRFARIWREHTVIPLTENWRSAPGIIDVANAIITRSESRFEPNKVMHPKDRPGRGRGLVEGVRLGAWQDDAPAIAAMILADRAASSPPRPWREYAVIARGHADLDRVADALRLEGIPFDRSAEKSQLDEPGVADVLAWMEWLVNPEAAWAARRILTRPPLGVDPETVVAWESAYRAQRSHARAGRDGSSDPGTYDAFLRHTAHPAATAACAMYDRLRREVGSSRGDEAVWRILRAADPAHAELLPPPERARRVAALVAFLGVVRDKQPRLEEPGDLRSLWQYLGDLRDLGALAPQRGLGDVDDEVRAAEGPDDESGRVHLTTAHSAKGLEFDTVFVPRIEPGKGYPKADSSDREYRPPEGLVEALDTRSEKERRLDEERRLFYVACTRAERRLVLLSKWTKSPSRSTNYFQELVPHRGEARGVVVLDGDRVLAAGAPGTALDAAGHGLARDAAREELAHRARVAARVRAAALLDAAARAGDAREIERIGAALAQEAGRMAAIAAVARSGAIPAWAGADDPELASLAAAARREEAAPSHRGAASLIRPMTAPLRLSYTALDKFSKCGLCYYLNARLGLIEEERGEANIGTALHAVLQKFYAQWRSADAEGTPRPGVEHLLRLGRHTYLQSLGPDRAVDDEALEQIDAQLRTLWTTLHDDAAQVLELEWQATLDYEVDGQRHELIAKIDRIDLMPDGSYRVIDYKSGRPWKSLVEPKADDLQMGIYAMALATLAGVPDPAGVTEYWLLSTGQRGVLPLAGINLDAVRARIDDAARKMLRGEFERGDKCEGACTLFA